MRTRHAWTLLFALLLAGCNSGPDHPTAVESPEQDTLGPQTAGQDSGTPTTGPSASRGHHGKPDLAETQLPYPTDEASVRSRQLPVLTDPKKTHSLGPSGMQSQSLTPLALGGNPSVVALKVLVISAGTNDPTLATAKTILSQHAVPFDVLDATTSDLTENTLVAADGSGKYQGVMLTTGGLGYQDAAGNWVSALTDPEWALLWSYEKTYQARQLALYTYPGSYPEDYGIRAAGGESSTNTATLTPAGQQVFPDLKTTTAVPINYAYNYPATTETVPGVTTTPLLTDSTGKILAVQSDTDGRQRLALTVDHNPYLLHSQLFSYGLINWLTSGLYLGEFRRYLQVDVDDWFIPDDLWNASTNSIQGEYRISASDALAVKTQQTAVRQKYPVASAFKLALLFNAEGANTTAPYDCSGTAPSADPLTGVSKCLSGTFDWVNHSLNHLSMDCIGYKQAYQQFDGNLTVADTLGLNVSRNSGVSGEHSGLGWYNKMCLDYDKTDYGLLASNKNFLNAAFDAGLRFLGSNRGVASHWDASCPNCGLPHPLKPSLFLVPRWPTNIFYYATTPAEVASSYNNVYKGSLTYPEILNKETEIAMYHVISGSMFPHYMHQTNLKQYESGKSLVFDWTNSILNNYSTYTTLPLRTLRWKDLGAYLKQRTGFIKTNVTGTWNRSTNSITLVSPTAVTAFVTGTSAGTSTERYGPTVISRVTLAANTPVTYTIQK